MKKCLMVLLAVGMLISSCSSYTCPTYTNAPAPDMDETTEVKV